MAVGPRPEGFGGLVASDLRLKAMNALHRSVIKVTGGRLGWTGGRLPMLELTTVGRATGQRRVTMLSSPLQMDDTIVS